MTARKGADDSYPSRLERSTSLARRFSTIGKAAAEADSARVARASDWKKRMLTAVRRMVSKVRVVKHEYELDDTRGKQLTTL